MKIAMASAAQSPSATPPGYIPRAYGAKKVSSDETETEYGRLGKPPADYEDLNSQLEEVQERFQRRVVELDEETRRDLEQELYINLRDWTDSRSSLEANLKHWNDLNEGVTPVTDFPWPGACSVHIPMPKIKGREIVATINRTTMRPIPFLTTTYAGPDSLYEESKEFVKELEDFVEDKIKNDTNVHETFKDGLIPTYRDGTCIPQITWATEYETVTDWKIYSDIQDFTGDYPSAEDAGISPSKYKDILSSLKKGVRYEAQFEYEAPIYDGPRGYLVPLIDFVHWPVWVSNIKDMKIHGKRIWYTDYQLEEKVRHKFFDKEDVDVVLKYFGGEVRYDRLTPSRDAIEGIARGTNRWKAKEYQLFELVYKGSLTKEDREKNIVRKYLVYYHLLSRRVLRCEAYPIRKGKTSYFPMRFIKRDNRFLGISLIDDISDLSSEVDTIHRQRINSRTITHVPSFKAKMTAKTVFDPSRRDFRFRPGVTFYLADVNDVAQFDIRPVDLTGSVEDEMLLYQLIDQTTGSSSGLSGQANPIDPRAPARKQQELLRQSNNRIDDYVQNLLTTFESAGQFVIDLYYQYGPDRIMYYTKTTDGQIVQKEMDRARLFDPNIKFKVNGTSVFASPELEYQRQQEIEAIIGQNPITMQNVRIRRNSLERLIMAARVNDEKAFIPNEQELPAAFTTDAAEEREAKFAQQREKMAARIMESQAKRTHEVDTMHIEADLEAQHKLLDVGLGGVPGSPNEASGGVPSAPSPVPSGIPQAPPQPMPQMPLAINGSVNGAP